PGDLVAYEDVDVLPRVLQPARHQLRPREGRPRQPAHHQRAEDGEHHRLGQPVRRPFPEHREVEQLLWRRSAELGIGHRALLGEPGTSYSIYRPSLTSGRSRRAGPPPLIAETV